jgi:hypothetical protein
MDVFALGLGIETKGAEQAKKVLNDIDAQGKQMATTFDRNSSSVSSNFAAIGRRATIAGSAIAAGSATGVSALQRLTNVTSSVAWGFGPAGPIVAAAGVAAVAIVGIFTRARKEMIETDRKARELLKSLTLESGSQLQGALFSGDEFGATGAARMGIARARQRQAALQALMPKPGMGAADAGTDTLQAERRELREINAFLKESEPLYERVAARVRTLTAARVESVTIGGRLAAEEEARNAGLRTAEQARTQELRSMEALRFALQEGRFALSQFNELEVVSIELARRATEARKEQSRTFAATLGPEGLGGYLNPTEATGNMKLPAGGLFVDWQEEINAEFQSMGAEAGATFADGIANGFEAAFSGGGIAGGFKALASTVLSGLGGIFIQMGKSLFMYGATMKGLLPFLSNPFTSGFAAMAAGAALIALGGALSGAMSGRGGGSMGGGYGGSFGGGATRGTEELTKIIIMPSNASTGAQREAVKPVVFAPTIIGVNDPTTNRAVKQMYDNAVGRSL